MFLPYLHIRQYSSLSLSCLRSCSFASPLFIWHGSKASTVTHLSALLSLQYSKYRDVGALGVLYNVVKAEAEQKFQFQTLT